MSDLPYMKFFIGDHVRDTHHLTLEEEGAYLRLMFKAWHMPDCAMPDDPDWIMRQLHCNKETYERSVVPVIAEFFTRENGRLFQARQRKEYSDAVTSHARRSKAGKAAAEQRWRAQATEDDEFP